METLKEVTIVGKINYRHLTEKQIKKIVEKQVRNIIVYCEGVSSEHFENELSDYFEATLSSVHFAMSRLVDEITGKLIDDGIFYDYASKEVVSGKKKYDVFIYTLMDWEKETDVEETIKSKVTEEDINKLQEIIKETMLSVLFDYFLAKNIEEQDDADD